MSGTKNHKPNCQCPVCRAKRGEDHTKDCQCATCKMKRGEVTGKNHPNYKRVKWKCKNCGKEKQVVPYYAENRNFCSRKCSGEYNAKYNLFTKEHREKLSEAAKGRKFTRKHKKKLSKAKIGRNLEDLGHSKECKCAVCQSKRGEWKITNKIIAKMEEGQKNREHSENCKCIRCCNYKGKKASNWQGGITSLHKLIRNSNLNEEWRNKIFKRDDYTCQKCKVKGDELEVHHIKHYSDIFNEFLEKYNQFSSSEDKEILTKLAEKYEPFWDVDNGISLCLDCHNEIHPKKGESIKC